MVDPKNYLEMGLVKKCYDVFHHHDHACEKCNIKKLLEKEGTPVNGLDYFEVLKGICFMTAIVQTVNGRKIRYERAIPFNGMTQEIHNMIHQYNLI